MVLVRLWDDKNENYLVIDEDGCAQTVNHHEYNLHKGRCFTANHLFYDSVADAKNDVLFVTNSTNYVHVWYDYDASGKAEFCLHKDVTVSAAGAAITSVNRNQRNSTDALCVVTHTPSVSSEGTELTTRLVTGTVTQSGKTAGGGSGLFGEFILEQSATYLFRCTDLTSDTADCMIALSWCEEPV